uniref:RanBP2-type domain-containing protein n=1 Tax=Magallana gigas TaxID=29159 RepID=A0A8W8MI03_MAGGI
MYHHATQTSLPICTSDAHKLQELQEENELLRGKIRGYLTLGNLFLEKKDECKALQEENLALKKTLEKLQTTSQSQNNRMNQEQEKKQTLPVKDKTSDPLTSINKPPNQQPTEQFPSYIHNSVPASNSSPEHMNGQPNSSSNLNRQLSTKVNYSSGNSLNLMEFPSVSESNHVISSPQEELFDPLIAEAVSNEDHKDEEIILSIKVSQVAVAMDLTTDGPAERMRKFLEELVPEIEKQEEETQKYKTCNLALKEEVDNLKSDRQSLLHKIQVLEHQVNNVSMGSSMSSQTQVLDWEQHRQTGRQKMENGLMVGKEQELEKLQRETQKWRDYFSQWTRDKEKLKAENDKLRSEISNFKTQDLKRQEEFDKILLNAKERTTEAEAQREEVQQKLDRLILKMAALEAEVHEKTDIISLLNRDKNTLEAEVTALRRTGNGIGMMNLTGNHSNEDLQQENAVLREQLTVFKEDFDRERSDRASAQSAKDDLRKELETEQRKVRNFQDQLKQAERHIHSAEKKLKHYMTENTQFTKENQRLKKELQHEKDRNAQQQYYQMMNRPPAPEYGTPYRAQPETDPMAKPVPPYMFQTGYAHNGLGEFSRPQMSNKAQLSPEQLPGAWGCPHCTYTNHPSRTVCEICGNIFTKEELQNYYHPNSNHSQPLMARGDTVTPSGEDPPDLCTDSGLKAAAAVNCH